MMSTAPKQRPNIVFILSDDQGAWAMGCAGNPDVRTPNLDRLAAEGMRFSNFFCTSPVCSPARASLLTGKIPSQHGVHDWIRAGNVGERPIEYLQGHTAYTDLLADAGYVCGISGKWHLGDSLRPQKGFSHWYVHQEGGGPYYNAPMVRDGRPVNEPGYITDVITDDALRFLDEQDGEKPFYLSVHYTAPHSPWINSHPQQYVDLYEDCAFESCPQEPRHPWAIPTAPWDDWRENLKGYYAAITAMDANIGRLLDKLDQRGLREQTLIVFLSDNGFNCGHHGIWGKGNGTFPQNMYDTSVKIPAVFSHPGRIPQGTVCDELASGYDVMPTLLDYVGLEFDGAGRLPGRSLLPLLEGRTASGRNEEVVILDEYGPVRMIRTREWKYIHRYPYGPHELYDLTHDPGERRNRIDDPDCEPIREALKARLDQWFVQYADPAVDGIREPVTGYGQLDLAGIKGRGSRTYHSG
jgi:arylsulfatase A-like enzyme